MFFGTTAVFLILAKGRQQNKRICAALGFFAPFVMIQALYKAISEPGRSNLNVLQLLQRRIPARRILQMMNAS